MIDATLYLLHLDGVYSDGSKSSSRFQYVGENGDVGSLAARGVIESDRTGVRQTFVVYLFPAVAARRYSSCAPASLAVCVDAVGTRGDITRDSGRALGSLYGFVSGPLAFDGEP
jgi:hypothetical protein